MRIRIVALALVMLLAQLLRATEFELSGYSFQLPDGFELELAASPPLVERPISADFDEQGRLYVSESSGSNDDIEKQLKEKPHRILRLVDVDGDGRFDERTIFADRMMLPEGTMWYDGSLYVAAPPQIWKLTDTTGDGRADQREVWFDGQTLTHCANDLHGPYLGPDGWFYWCKGAFAEQTYPRPGRPPLVTRAAHIFRRHPQGGLVEPVMTGGMANPVDIVFTPGGERIFSTTFLTLPHAGLRDGLIHAVYGGVYGRENGVLEGHPHTGPLMPVLDHLGAAAPCGLVRLESNQLSDINRDDHYQDNLLTCLFNMQKVTRHQLSESGATFVSQTTDFLTSDHRDFHPTDVIEDADGSLLVIDTGGWYKLCCPTSQLWKPEIPGAIYRVRRRDAHRIADPRGIQISWSQQNIAQLCVLLADDRHAVRRRASQTLAQRGSRAVRNLHELLRTSNDLQQRLQAVWTLTKIDLPAARAAVRIGLEDTNQTVRQAALHSVSLWRDRAAEPAVAKLLTGQSPQNRRAAAEAMGRIGSTAATRQVLSAAAQVEDRFLQHSLTYAALEIADAQAVRKGLQQDDPAVQSVALVALDQMQDGLAVRDVLPFLDVDQQRLRDTAWWIVQRHPEWRADLKLVVRRALRYRGTDDPSQQAVIARLAQLAGHEVIQQEMAAALGDPALSSEMQRKIFASMAAAEMEPLPAVWTAPLRRALATADVARCELAVAVLSSQKNTPLPGSISEALEQIGENASLPARLRLQALAQLAAERLTLDDKLVHLLCEHLVSDQPVRLRSLAVDILAKAPLTDDQRRMVAANIPRTGPMELQRLVEILSKSRDRSFGKFFVAQLSECPAVTALRPDELRQHLSGFGHGIRPATDLLVARIKKENGEILQKLDAALKLTGSADIRRGQELFHSSTTACSACHALGYLGGRIGPDLTRIGRIRSERDLLEAILLPSISFVQNYEPVTIVTTEGHMLNGTIKHETSAEIVLQVDAQKTARVGLDEIEHRRPGTISIMPAGLDKQLNLQQLADLVAFLKSAN